MKTLVGMIVLLLVGSFAFSGCTVAQPSSSSKSGADDSSAAKDAPATDTVAAPAAIQFTFYDSFANW